MDMRSPFYLIKALLDFPGFPQAEVGSGRIDFVQRFTGTPFQHRVGRTRSNLDRSLFA
jgi:hypothetical protein